MCSLRRPLILIAAGILAVPALTLPRDALAPRSDEINMPSIQPPFSEEVQDKHFRAVLPYQRWRLKDWGPAWIPKNCLEEAQNNQFSPSDFTVRDVWFEDCSAPWTICRHKDSKEQWDLIINVFSPSPRPPSLPLSLPKPTLSSHY